MPTNSSTQCLAHSGWWIRLARYLNVNSSEIMINKIFRAQSLQDNDFLDLRTKSRLLCLHGAWCIMFLEAPTWTPEEWKIVILMGHSGCSLYGRICDWKVTLKWFCNILTPVNKRTKLPSSYWKTEAHKRSPAGTTTNPDHMSLGERKSWLQKEH